jgi:DNA polymerase
MYKVVLDFETRSAADLRKVGAWNYSRHPTTEVMCLSYRVKRSDGGRTAVRRWEPLLTNSVELPGPPPPRELMELARRPEVVFEAFNAGFEISIWQNIMVPRWGAPDVDLSRWEDTQAMALHRGLAPNLENSARVSGVGEKDTEGNKLLQKLCKPRKPRKDERKLYPDHQNMLFWHEDATDLKRLGEYCDQDVEVEDRLGDYCGSLPADEHEVFLLDMRMNLRGLLIDVPAARAAKRVMGKVTAEINQEVAELTRGEVTTTGQDEKIKEFIRDQCGKAPSNLQKDTVEKFISNQKIQKQHPEVHRLMELRKAGAKSSTAKLDAMLNHADDVDHRARFQLQYQGAPSTGRWAGRGIQPQNIPGNAFDCSVEDLIELIQSEDLGRIRELGDPAEVVSSALRPMIRAGDGRKIVAGDFSAIEARVVLAFAEQWDKVELMAGGHDVYCDMASTIFGYPVLGKKEHPAERQVGKNAVLGLGFQCGAPTFQEKFCTDRELEFCETVVGTYRHEWAPNVPKLWQGLESAAVGAVANPGRVYSYGPIEYQMEGDWLSARLPSGRKLWYHGAHTTLKPMPWDAEDKRLAICYYAWKYGQWQRQDTYGGKLTENVVQAAARDIMANSLLAAEAGGHNPILTVHDEVACEPLEDGIEPGDFEDLMVNCQPSWVRDCGIPVAVEAWSGGRYQK